MGIEGYSTMFNVQAVHSIGGYALVLHTTTVLCTVRKKAKQKYNRHHQIIINMTSSPLRRINTEEFANLRRSSLQFIHSSNRTIKCQRDHLSGRSGNQGQHTKLPLGHDYTSISKRQSML